MTVIQRSALLPYSDQAMFDLVNDIESYPEFMDGCVGAEILSQSSENVTARLDLGKAGLSYSFTTSNRLAPPHSMEMELLEGPFKKFSAHWKFKALQEDACKVSLFMEFTFKEGLVDVILEKIFDAYSNKLMDAVCKRAAVLYGK